MSEERRSGGGSPPTMIMQAFKEMDDDDVNRMEKLGYGMVIGSAGIVLIAGLFLELSIPYLVFAGAVGSLGVCFIFPPLGVWFIDIALKAVAATVPALRSTIRPDSRASTEDQGE